MAKGEKRVKVTLACEQCKRRNYITMKNKQNDRERMEIKKYCRGTGRTPPTGRPASRRRGSTSSTPSWPDEFEEPFRNLSGADGVVVR